MRKNLEVIYRSLSNRASFFSQTGWMNGYASGTSSQLANGFNHMLRAVSDFSNFMNDPKAYLTKEFWEENLIFALLWLIIGWCVGSLIRWVIALLLIVNRMEYSIILITRSIVLLYGLAVSYRSKGASWELIKIIFYNSPFVLIPIFGGFKVFGLTEEKKPNSQDVENSNMTRTQNDFVAYGNNNGNG